MTIVSPAARESFTRAPPGPRGIGRGLEALLRADHLTSMTEEPHVLSLLLNDNGDGSSSFRFFGSDGVERYKHDTQIDGQLLSSFLLQARGALRKVSWGDEEEWDPKKGFSYRYQTQSFDEKKLAKDLAYLARAGSRIYSGFQLHLNKKRSELDALLSNSGLIQIALKLSPRAVLPAAVVYDYAWNPNQFKFTTTDFELCGSFSKALKEARDGGPPLEDAVCFKGGCELKAMIAELQKQKKSLNNLRPIICPSGFWGYRHLLGLPLTLDGALALDWDEPSISANGRCSRRSKSLSSPGLNGLDIEEYHPEWLEPVTAAYGQTQYGIIRQALVWQMSSAYARGLS